MKKQPPPTVIGPEPEITDEQLWGLISNTEFGKKTDQTTFLLKQQIGRALTAPILGRMIVVGGMSKMADIDDAIKNLKELSEQNVDGEVAARSLGGIATCVDAYTRLTERMFQISKEINGGSKPAEVKQEVPKFYQQIVINGKGDDAKAGTVVELKPVEVK